jgi:hypothetical protein
MDFFIELAFLIFNEIAKKFGWQERYRLRTKR